MLLKFTLKPKEGVLISLSLTREDSDTVLDMVVLMSKQYTLPLPVDHFQGFSGRFTIWLDKIVFQSKTFFVFALNLRMSFFFFLRHSFSV